MGGPELTRRGEALTWIWREQGYAVTIDRFIDRYDGPHAEVTVESVQVDQNGHPGHVHWSNLNLASTSERYRIAQKLAVQDGRVNWAAILEMSCCWTVKIRREGEPMTNLAEVKNGVAKRSFLMSKLLPAGETSMIYGDGASGKSLLAQMVAVACQEGRSLPGGLICTGAVPVIYYDWETNERVIRRRLERLCVGWKTVVPPLRYVPMRRPMIEDVYRMRRDIDEVGAGLVVIDSVGFASAQGDLTQADAATKLFNALRYLDTTVLAVHHLTKEASERQTGPVKPYGSSYFYNATRNAWEVRSRQESNKLIVSLWHRKDNDGFMGRRPIGLRFVFDGEEGPIRIEQTEIEEDSELATHGGLAFQLRGILKEGATTVAEMAIVTGADKGTVARTLRRMPDVANLNPSVGSGNVATWGLVAREDDY